MRLALALLVGRLARWVTRLRGGGSALPGLLARLVLPGILPLTIGKVSGGIVFVTGSNGKSTTTAMLVSILRGHGLRVFTNPAGSNLPQGLASAVVAVSPLSGVLKADIAVLEIDEAYGPLIARELTPDYLVITNLQVDQLNRFGEPERVWEMMRTVARVTRRGLLVNRREQALLALAHSLPSGAQLQVIDVSDEALRGSAVGLVEAHIDVPESSQVTPGPSVTEVEEVIGARARLTMASGESADVSLPGPGLHYAVDAALAVAAAQLVLPRVETTRSLEALATLPPVYGRGESVSYRGVSFHVVMQKNLPSMQVNLSALSERPEVVWVAVDEGTPDPSWIFDLDLGLVDHVDVLSGSKAWAWATFLGYRGLPVGKVIEDTRAAMDYLASLEREGHPVTALVNYEQMMKLRRIAGYLELEGAS